MNNLKIPAFIAIIILISLFTIHCEEPEVGDDDDSDDDDADEGNDDFSDDDDNDDFDDDANDDVDDDIDDDSDDDVDDDDVDDDIWDDDVDDDVLTPECPELPWMSDTVELPITLQNGPELNSFGFSLTFPLDSLQFTDIADGDVLEPNQIRCSFEASSYIACAVDPLPLSIPADTDGVLATLRFQVKNSPDTASFMIYDMSGDLAGNPDSQCNS